MSKVSAFVAEQTNVAKMHERLNAKCGDCGLIPGDHCREHFVAEIERLRAAGLVLLDVGGPGGGRPCSDWPSCGYIGCDMAAPNARRWDAAAAVFQRTTSARPAADE